jgi:hypothetical protein
MTNVSSMDEEPDIHHYIDFGHNCMCILNVKAAFRLFWSAECIHVDVQVHWQTVTMADSAERSALLQEGKGDEDEKRMSYALRFMSIDGTY